jgi:CRISPR/Cas system CSM-associated protein Csm5 (group 7 of RAMP superfamily)
MIVLSGVEGIVGYDVIIRDRDVCIVDFNALPPEVIERLASAKDIRDIASTMESFKNVIPCRLTSINNVGRLTINTRVKLPHEHIVPGSTLKGYLRTAILYHILTSRSLSCDDLRKLIDFWDEPKNLTSRLERYIFKYQRLKPQGGEVDMLQNLYVSDPIVGESIKFSLEWLNVFERKELASRTHKPIARIAGFVLLDGTLKFILSILKTMPKFVAPQQIASSLEATIMKLNEVVGLDILGTLREFGCSLLEYELKMLEGIELLKEYKALLEDFKSRYCATSRGNCTVARIGFMTGHMAKTIDLYLEKNCPNIYEDVKKYMSAKVRRLWDEATIKLVGPSTSPYRLRGLGWCELCIETLSS